MIRTAQRSAKIRLPPRDPKGGRPPQDVAEKLGAHILDAALEQFTRQGVEATSMESIAAAANVSKRTLYARFGSKTDLLMSVIEYGLARYFKPLSTRIAEGSARERLLDVGSKLLDTSLRSETIGIERLVTWITNEQPALYETLYERGVAMAIAIIETILEDGARQGELVMTDKAFTAAFVCEALIITPRNLILSGKRLSDTKAAKRAYLQSAIDVLFAGLTPR